MQCIFVGLSPQYYRHRQQASNSCWKLCVLLRFLLPRGNVPESPALCSIIFAVILTIGITSLPFIALCLLPSLNKCKNLSLSTTECKHLRNVKTGSSLSVFCYLIEQSTCFFIASYCKINPTIQYKL